jgi:hypothetical protein
LSAGTANSASEAGLAWVVLVYRLGIRSIAASTAVAAITAVA